MGCLQLQYYQTAELKIISLKKDLTCGKSNLKARRYLPYGELFVEQRNSVYSTPYKFSGKELDQETGYSYFGARYYMPELSIWNSTDPLMDKYPNISPFAYCNWNPIRFTDPDGMEWVDGDGNKISEKQQKNIKVYIFYDPKSFEGQAKQMYKDAEAKYGKGTVAMSNVTTETEFAQDWADMGGTNIKEVNLNYHGSNQQLHLDWKNQEYIVSTETGKTSSMGKSGTDIKDLPQSCGNVNNAILKVNSCHSIDKNDKDMPLKGSGLTVAESFRKYTNFSIIRATTGSVNYNKNGRPTPQWYFGRGWEYLYKSFGQKK